MIYLQRLNTQGSANKLGNIFWEGLHDAAYMTGNALDKLSQHGPFTKQHGKCWKVLHCYCWCLHGDSQIVLSCLTSCLQFWLRFLATWNILEGLEKYDKWYIILSHSRCSYMFLSFLAIETCGHRLLTHTYMRTTTPWWNRYLMMFAESSVDLGQLCQHSTDPGGTCSIQYTGM